MLNVFNRHDIMRHLHRNITKSWSVLNTQIGRCKGTGKSRSIGKGKSRGIGKGKGVGKGQGNDKLWPEAVSGIPNASFPLAIICSTISCNTLSMALLKPVLPLPCCIYSCTSHTGRTTLSHVVRVSNRSHLIKLCTDVATLKNVKKESDVTCFSVRYVGISACCRIHWQL